MNKRIAVADYRLEFLDKMAAHIGEQRHVTLGRIIDHAKSRESIGSTCTGLAPLHPEATLTRPNYG